MNEKYTFVEAEKTTHGFASPCRLLYVARSSFYARQASAKSRIAATNPRVTKIWADTGYRTRATDHGARLGIDVEVVQRHPGTQGFKVIPRQWVVERTFGRLMHHRHRARDYETYSHRSEAIIHVAVIDLTSRRLTHEATPSRHDTWTSNQTLPSGQIGL